jgi:epoxyqueuosine reductase
LPFALDDQPEMTSPCTGCSAPCQAACPGHAVRPEGLYLLGCANHRWQDQQCHHTCVARRACIVAPEQAYPPAQLEFHMAASLASVRRYFGG